MNEHLIPDYASEYDRGRLQDAFKLLKSFGLVAVTLPDVITYDPSKKRSYIPLPGGWEIQTKGNGSTFRLVETTDGRRLGIPDFPYLHEYLERMARAIHTAVAGTTPS